MSFYKDKVFWLFVSLGFISIFITSLLKTNYSPFWYIDRPLQFFNLIIVSSIVEEILFRGLLYIALEKVLSQKYTVLASSFAFAIAHVYLHSPVWALLVFFPGICFGVLRCRSGKITGAIVLHLFFNLLYFSLYEF